MNMEQSCTSCGGTGKEPSDALRAALEAAVEHRKSIGCGSYIRPDSLTEIVKAALTEFVRVSEQDKQDAEPIPPPIVRRVWRTHADTPPGLEVIAVRDDDHDVWIRDTTRLDRWCWRNDESTWANLVEDCGPLEDWTHEVD